MHGGCDMRRYTLYTRSERCARSRDEKRGENCICIASSIGAAIARRIASITHRRAARIAYYGVCEVYCVAARRMHAGGRAAARRGTDAPMRCDACDAAACMCMLVTLLRGAARAAGGPRARGRDGSDRDIYDGLTDWQGAL